MFSAARVHSVSIAISDSRSSAVTSNAVMCICCGAGVVMPC